MFERRSILRSIGISIVALFVPKISKGTPLHPHPHRKHELCCPFPEWKIYFRDSIEQETLIAKMNLPDGQAPPPTRAYNGRHHQLWKVNHNSRIAIYRRGETALNRAQRAWKVYEDASTSVSNPLDKIPRFLNPDDASSLQRTAAYQTDEWMKEVEAAQAQIPMFAAENSRLI